MYNMLNIHIVSLNSQRMSVTVEMCRNLQINNVSHLPHSDYQHNWAYSIHLKYAHQLLPHWTIITP